MEKTPSDKQEILQSLLGGHIKKELLESDKKIRLLHNLLSPTPLGGVEDLENEVKPVFKYIGPESWYSALNKKERKRKK